MTEEIQVIPEPVTPPPVPPKVAAAIAAVMGEVPKLAKGEKNSHGNYNFASIDDFLEAVRPLCAKNGLIILQDEESFDTRQGVDKNGKNVMWLVMRFSFTLAHASGETWAHRPCRSIMVNASMGSQAFGAAQSYALKQFERALFQIATGESDEDADSHPHGDLPTGAKSNGKAPAPKAEPTKKSASPEPLTGDPREIEFKNDWIAWGGLFVATIKAAPDLDTLNGWVRENTQQLVDMEQKARKAYDRVEAVLDERRAALAPKESEAA